VNADALQEDFSNFRNELRLTSTMCVCCACGESCELSEIACAAGAQATPIDFTAAHFPAIPGFSFLESPSGQSERFICHGCLPHLRKGKRPPRAYHFPPPDELLSCLNPHELRLVKPLVPCFQLRRLFGAGGAMQYGMTGLVASWENDSARVAARLPRMP
jgi:hypothetical protein